MVTSDSLSSNLETERKKLQNITRQNFHPIKSLPLGVNFPICL